MNRPFYNSNIQLHTKVIDDIFKNFTKDTKFLVYGLGYDSKMWFNGNKNTFFVEDNDFYIELNKDIPKTNIIKYDYKDITVKKSMTMTDDEINTYDIPQKLLDESPFDIILIDGPAGYEEDKFGRLLPFHWCSKLAKKDTIIYADDCKRELEKYCIDKYFSDKKKYYFTERMGCCKIIV
uniref:Uncharacterized protein n=1 Tax=viral metagenome TaxID=1070528 RepID=A0A6C0EF72_9ZZZZ